MPTHNGTALVGPASCLAPEVALKWGIIGGRQKWSREEAPGRPLAADKSLPCRYPSSRIRQIIPESRRDPSVRDELNIHSHRLGPTPVKELPTVATPSRQGVSLAGNRNCAARPWVRRHVDLGMARVVGCVCHPLTVRRENDARLPEP